jgi:hypothetical protein
VGAAVAVGNGWLVAVGATIVVGVGTTAVAGTAATVGVGGIGVGTAASGGRGVGGAPPAEEHATMGATATATAPRVNRASSCRRPIGLERDRLTRPGMRPPSVMDPLGARQRTDGASARVPGSGVHTEIPQPGRSVDSLLVTRRDDRPLHCPLTGAETRHAHSNTILPVAARSARLNASGPSAIEKRWVTTLSRSIFWRRKKSHISQNDPIGKMLDP